MDPRHADRAGQAELRLRPTELPETWFPDLRVTVECVWGPMARVVDVAGIQGMPVSVGGFTAHLTDSLCPWNEGNWRFEAVDGRLRVSRSETADCELAIQGLTGLVFGTHSAADFAFRGWGQPTRQTQAAMHGALPADATAVSARVVLRRVRFIRVVQSQLCEDLSGFCIFVNCRIG